MGESVAVRRASSQDVEAMLALAEVRRGQYAVYQPVFWRPASNAVERQRRYFEGLLADERVIALVAVTGMGLRGFAVARFMGSPPVYDSGGETCMVDDFTVTDPADWATVGVTLLRAVQQAALSRGAAQIVVVTAHLDEPKRTALAASGLSLASEWWVIAGGTN